MLFADFKEAYNAGEYNNLTRFYITSFYYTDVFQPASRHLLPEEVVYDPDHGFTKRDTNGRMLTFLSTHHTKYSKESVEVSLTLEEANMVYAKQCDTVLTQIPVRELELQRNLRNIITKAVKAKTKAERQLAPTGFKPTAGDNTGALDLLDIEEGERVYITDLRYESVHKSPARNVPPTQAINENNRFTKIGANGNPISTTFAQYDTSGWHAIQVFRTLEEANIRHIEQCDIVIAQAEEAQVHLNTYFQNMTARVNKAKAKASKTARKVK